MSTLRRSIPRPHRRLAHHLGAARGDVPHLTGAAVAARRVVKSGRDTHQPPCQPVLTVSSSSQHPVSFERLEEGREFFVLMLFASVGLVTVGDEKRVALVAEAVFYDRVWFVCKKLSRPARWIDRASADSRPTIATRLWPPTRARPGADHRSAPCPAGW